MIRRDTLQSATKALEAGQPAEAEKLCRDLLSVDPANAQAWFALATILNELGKLPESMDAFRQAATFAPHFPETHYSLGVVLSRLGRRDEAIRAYRDAISAEDQFPEAHFNLANLLRETGHLAESIDHYQRALDLRPEMTEAQPAMAAALAQAGRISDAIQLGATLRQLGHTEQAAECFRRAIELQPTHAALYLGLANSLRDQGKITQAIASLRAAVARAPHSSQIHEDLLFKLLYSPDIDDATLFAEHQTWARRHAEPLSLHLRPHDNDRTPNRRLRIGYVSPNFKRHVIGKLLEPLLAHHDHQAFEIFCYADVPHPDDLTDRLKSHADVWRPTTGVSDEALAAQIRQDRIDILVDLNLHMPASRMLAFAPKPAPVQATYLAYCATSGLTTMDYLLTDVHLQSPGQPTPYQTEQPAHVGVSYWCFSPEDSAPPVTELPAKTGAPITFASMTSLPKVTDPMIHLWARILQRVPNSTLICMVRGGEENRPIRRWFESHGITGSRLQLMPFVPVQDFLALCQRIDIALDTFPYNGGTSTMDTMWMGVPTITFIGQRPLSRAGLSILTNVGLTELIANTPDDYVNAAVALAQDIPRLAALRRDLRERMRQSPLMDAPRFARDIEATYRRMWLTWCSEPAPT